MESDPDRRLSWQQVRLAGDMVVAVLVTGACLALVICLDTSGAFAEFSRNYEPFYEGMAVALILGGAIVFSYRRVEDWREAQREAQKLAGLDVLTGIANRRQFLDHLSKIDGPYAKPEQLAVFVLDLNDFKKLNDLYGHQVGDQVLRIMAKRLVGSSPDCALVARIGGDEFGVLLPFDREDEVRLAAQRIITKLPESIEIASLLLNVDISVGIELWTPCGIEPNKVADDALIKQDGSASGTLLRRAEAALGNARRAGGSNYHFFLPNMEAELRERILLEREIGSAIKAGQIIPHYQPLVDLHTGAVMGCEILARWKHPTRGLLPPSTFIPVAEATGNISALTFALLRQGIRDAQTWPEPLSISLNWPSAMAADEWTSAEVLKILTESEFPAHRLELEITETTLIDRPEDAKNQFKSLSNLGVRIALDDFGSGYSGLIYLREFHVDKVKLDRSYIQNILVDQHDQELVRSLIGFCHALELSVTAEGIETLELRNRLMEFGCDVGQGYLFSKPRPSRSFALWLRRFADQHNSPASGRADDRAPPEPRDSERNARITPNEFQALDLLPSQVALLDRQGNIIHTNRAWDSVVQGRPTDRGRNYLEECRAATDRGCSDSRAIGDGIAKVLSREASEFIANYPCPFGRKHHWHQIAVRPGRASDERIGAIVTHTDVTSLQYDHLTGLANRALFEAQAEYALDMARQNVSMVGVALIDLDGFKPINDEYGHAAGDAVLIEVAKRLRSSVGNDLVARLGGDEFGVVTWIDCHEVYLSRLARDIKLAFKKPFVIEGAPATYLSASVGTALSPADGETLETLLKSADSRMYGLKRALRRQNSELDRLA